MTPCELAGVDETPTWRGGIQETLATCRGCHRDPPINGAPFSLLTYENVVAHLDRVRFRAVQDRTMPPGAPLADRKRALLGCWIASGAPLGEAAGDADPPTEAPAYDPEIRGIFNANCAFDGCHAGETRRRELDLSSYAGFRRGGLGGDLTGGGDPERSLLIKRLRGEDGLIRMPLSGPYLEEDVMAVLEAWIRAGAPETKP